MNWWEWRESKQPSPALLSMNCNGPSAFANPVNPCKFLSLVQTYYKKQVICPIPCGTDLQAHSNPSSQFQQQHQQVGAFIKTQPANTAWDCRYPQSLWSHTLWASLLYPDPCLAWFTAFFVRISFGYWTFSRMNENNIENFCQLWITAFNSVRGGEKKKSSICIL